MDNTLEINKDLEQEFRGFIECLDSRNTDVMINDITSIITLLKAVNYETLLKALILFDTDYWEEHNVERKLSKETTLFILEDISEFANSLVSSLLHDDTISTFKNNIEFEGDLRTSNKYARININSDLYITTEEWETLSNVRSEYVLSHNFEDRTLELTYKDNKIVVTNRYQLLDLMRVIL